MNFLHRFVRLAVFASATFLLFQHLDAQSPGVTANVQFSNGQSVNVADFSGLIGIQPQELVNVRLQFTPDAFGEPIIIDALGGGRTSIGNSIRVVEADGSLSFAYITTASPGPRSIGIRRGSSTSCMQFWVLDPAHPKNNPPVITPGNHG
jgi:hypothetical protein